MMQAERIWDRNNKAVLGRGFILYWMQAAQRAEYNYALEYAVRLANQRHKPVVAAFSLTSN